MADDNVMTPYSTAKPLFGALPTWIDPYDAQRLSAYDVYENMYWNVPETFKLEMRGSDNDQPIYIPSARTIIDTTNRYLCPNSGFIVDRDAGSSQEQLLVSQLMGKLFRREKFWSKFNSSKRFGLIRGDWCFHIRANDKKPLGRRINIEVLDPGAYFPVTHPDDPDRIIAVHIFEQIIDKDGKTRVKRQSYWKGKDPVANLGDDETIWSSTAIFELEAWQSLDDKATTLLVPPFQLPPAIKAIPVYHIRNLETPGDPFGSSELRGFERIMSAINQAISDEEMALALEGLGMYETDGGPPRDENGNITDWFIGPGRVLEHNDGSTFSRVTGVGSVQPVQDHLRFLIQALREGAATPDAAIGKVDVAVAESGISLVMQLGPLLSKIEEREQPVSDTMFQMFYDFCQMWFPAYEQLATPCVAEPVWGSAVPEDKTEKFNQVMAIVTNQIADAEWARQQLEKLGWDFDVGVAGRLIAEAQARQRAQDEFLTRMEAELDIDANATN